VNSTAGSLNLKPNKYRVSTPDRRTFGGKVYASRAEMHYARYLSLERDTEAGSVLEFVEQPRVWLGIRENVYVPDFLVVLRSGGAYFVDVKGMETPAFCKHKRLWRKYARLPLHVVEVSTLGIPQLREAVLPDSES